MKSKVKRILSVIMTMCMLTTMVPLTAYGAETDFTDVAANVQDTAEEPTASADEEESLSADEEGSSVVDEESSAVDVETEIDEEADTQADTGVEIVPETESETAEETVDETAGLSDDVEAEAFTDDADAAGAADLDTVYATTGASVPAQASSFYKIVHVDCGRKYFSISSLETIIDNAAAAGFNFVELAVGNDGLRFLLNDMSVTVDGTTYDSDSVTSAIKAGNTAYTTASTGELSQGEMDSIIAYASDKGVSIIPLINSPGHMDAILSAYKTLTGTSGAYRSSSRTVDVTNAGAVSFTYALIQKYISYFAGKGLKVFNMGADEYANDVCTGTGMGFGQLQSEGNYQYFVKYVNKMADMIKSSGMIPMAFNDGIYYNNVTSQGTFDTSILVSYWSNGWSGYTPASALTLSGMGFGLINTNGDYYWVLGGSQCSADKAKGFVSTSFMGSTINNPAGAMFCIWSDSPGADSDSGVAANTASAISSFGAALSTGNADDADSTGSTEVTQTKTITLEVGATATDTISGANYATEAGYTTADPSIATVAVTGKDGGTTYTQASSVSVTSLLNRNSSNWTATNYYYSVDGNYYPLYVKRSNSSDYYYYYDYTYTYGYQKDGSVTEIGTQSYNNWSSSSGVNINIYNTAEETASTSVTFTGVAIGETSVTVGNTAYTIKVVDEDLSAVTGVTVEFWITNRQVTANNATSMTINATDANVNSAAGAKIADLVPATGTRDNDTMVYWKATRLASDNKQTATSGVDRTLSGTDFTYIRYYDKQWSYSADGETWTAVASDDQLVAYYLQKTTVTDEVTTEVVDWGVERSDYNSINYVLLDYAVKYEDGTLTPNTFPVSGKTLAFHCDSYDTTTVHRDSTTGVYYRTIGQIKAAETDDFEVYMITVTPTSDTATDAVAGNAMNATSYTYDGTEKIIWVESQETLAEQELQTHTDMTVGGEAVVNKLNIYNQQGMLVTYYVRAKSGLKVHYINQTANYEFYSYNIAVKKDTVFDKGFALSNGSLVNNTVTNFLNKTQTVSSDLSTMPEIGAKYRKAKYTIVDAKRSEDGKEVYLYYTFNNTAAFVIDFGLQLSIPISDMGLDDTDGCSFLKVQNGTYGTAALSEGNIIYTPTSVLMGPDQISATLKMSADDKEGTTYIIYIYPATTVYYEEGFATYSAGWSGGSKGSGTQTTSVVGDKTKGYHYGYDAKYASENVGPSNNSEAKTSTVGSSATFTFTGTGVDVYANCDGATGIVLIRNSTSGTLKGIYAVDTEFTHEENATEATSGQSGSAYSQPIVSIQNLAWAQYTVTVTFSNSSANATREDVAIDGFRVYNTITASEDSATVTNVYEKDGEANPSYVELRDRVLASLNVSASDSKDYAKQLADNIISQIYSKEANEGAVVITKDSSPYVNANKQDLLDNGTKNELLLYTGQSVIFKLAEGSNYQIGLKALNGTVSYQIGSSAAVTLTSSTDMFYPLNAGNITITNNGNGILAITKIKCIGKTANAAIMMLSAEDVEEALVGLSYTDDFEPTAAPTATPVPTQKVTLDTPKLGNVTSTGTKKMTVTWDKVAGADGYRVYVKTNGKWKALGDTTATSYTYTKAKTGQNYTFTVKAYKKVNGEKIWSGYDKNGITGEASLSAPVLAKVKQFGSKAIVTWKKVSGASGYAVYRKTGNGSWKYVGRVTKGNFFTDKNLKRGTTYSYTVRAYAVVNGKNIYSSYDKDGLSVKIK